MHVKKGDTVKILSGDDRGKSGKVLRVLPKKNRVIVEGVNYIKKHVKKSQQNPQGGRIEKEAALDSSKVELVAENKEKPAKKTAAK